MPNRETHEPIGVLAGGIAASVVAGKAGSNILAVGFGGAMAGWLGAKLPDWIDPPTSPGHRSIGHGVVPVLLVLRSAAARVPEWQVDLRRKAAEHRAGRESAPTTWEQILHQLLELLCLVASGALTGLLWGYGSHLAMDATTPASLPIFVKGL